MSDTRTRPRRGFGRKPDDGPRATFRQLLPYITEHKAVLGWVILLSIIGAAATLAQPLLVSQVITRVEASEPLDSLVWILAGLVVAAALISGFQHYLLQRTGTSVVLSARRRLVYRMLRLPIKEFDRRRTGDLVSRVGSDTTMLYAVMTQGLIDAIGGALIFVGALIAMLLIDPVLLGLTVLVITFSVVIVVLLSGRIRKASQAQQQKVGDLAASVERVLSAIRTVRAANATNRETEIVDEEARGAWRMGLKVAKISALVVPVAGIAMQVTFLTVIGVGGFRVATGAITIAALVSFIIFLFMMIGPLGQAFGAVTSVNQALGALGRIQEIIELPSEDEADVAGRPVAAIESDDAISFEEVEFTYPAEPPVEPAEGRDGGLDKLDQRDGLNLRDGLNPRDADEPGEIRDRTVLRGVSFSVPRGQRIALVGPSGAGKSTILALIERFYDPTAGVVRMGGVDVRALDRAELRGQIGYVEQDAPVLAGTIRDNLILGTPDATDEQCVDVLRSVNLIGVLERDERGLDAQVGEDGVMLSGGERQRLAIARTLLSAPPILLLDESTSSLDGLNEQLLREAIDAVAENRTLIVIAHRLSTVVDSDQIVVLEQGRVVGVGTHSELVVSTPLYRDLAKHQLLV
ncbi:ABC transporter ATP-binding protein [Diaminobutyricimonas sp. LJ205]|uniref:ABC transporter ATP-binding protein n=1 Tax=Diaminobutyricimonas sp. LJ205 TaxID=2683590 RepID=UPI0012F4E830|nr:ABC transporter ATP-binding protein [Diaminobutyricimonas sp. LJ205]